MDRRMTNDLDNHITGHYGEDQFQRPELLQCDMEAQCTAPVTHIDAKGYLYCKRHGQQRQCSMRCRALNPAELKRLQAGGTIVYDKAKNGWNRDWETDNLPDDMTGEPVDMSDVHVVTCDGCDFPISECRCKQVLAHERCPKCGNYGDAPTHKFCTRG